MSLTQREERSILECSIERVINTTITVLHEVRHEDERLEEFRDTAENDWLEHKALVVKLWENERERIWQRARNKEL